MEFVFQLLCCGEPVHDWHPVVHDDDVRFRLKLVHLLDRLCPVEGDPHYTVPALGENCLVDLME